MKQPEYYQDREQTYLKHFFLERYLEKVAYNILSFRSEFVYVDGFSGPWRSKDEAFEDTSFVIALNRLRNVRDGLRSRGSNVKIRCLFIEKDKVAFRQMEQAVGDVRDMNVTPLHGTFENLIPDILRFVGTSFSLVFIDPPGWTGFGLKEIRPILQHRPGEVLLNFMFDHSNRFLDGARPEIAATFDLMFGGEEWNSEVEVLMNEGMSREDAVLEVYRERFRKAGSFDHVTSTRILKPLAARSYFHLVYGTRHWKGLVEFRAVEKRAVSAQEEVRHVAQHAHRIKRTGQEELFSPDNLPGVPRSFDEDRAKRLEAAQTSLRDMLAATPRIKFEVILGTLLEYPLVWDSDVKAWLRDMRAANEIEIEGLREGAQTPMPGCVIVRK